MITEEKIQKARKQLRRGTPQGEIENELRTEGHTEEEIQMIYEPFKTSKMRSWYLFFGVVFLLAALFSLITRKQDFSLLLIVASVVLLYLYYSETQKIKKEDTR